jgi:hypothetical protein
MSEICPRSQRESGTLHVYCTSAMVIEPHGKSREWNFKGWMEGWKRQLGISGVGTG